MANCFSITLTFSAAGTYSVGSSSILSSTNIDNIEILSKPSGATATCPSEYQVTVDTAGSYKLKYTLKTVLTSTYQMFKDVTYITDTVFSCFDNSSNTNMQEMFSGCTGLTSISLSGLNTSNVTNMSYMFYNCSNLVSADLFNFRTTNVTDYQYMFDGCSSLTKLNIANFSRTSGATVTNAFSTLSYDLVYALFNIAMKEPFMIISNNDDASQFLPSSTSAKSIDLSNLSAWTSLASGEYVIDIRPCVGTSEGPASKNIFTVYK